MAHSYEAPNSIKLWGYSYVEYLIANMHELNPIGDSHQYIRAVYGIGVNLTAHSYEAPNSKSYGVRVNFVGVCYGVLDNIGLTP